MENVSACNPEVSNVILKAVDDAIAMVSKVPLCSYCVLIMVNAFEVCLRCSEVISDGTYPVGIFRNKCCKRLFSHHQC